MFFKRAESGIPPSLLFDGGAVLLGMVLTSETEPHEAPLSTRVTFPVFTPHLKNVKGTL